jgi:hypothetical protein
MRNERVNKILISTIQMVSIVCAYVWTHNLFLEHRIWPRLLYILPILASLLSSFALSIFLEMQITQKSVARISLPAAVVYFTLYVFEPLVFRFQPDFFLGICGFLFPFTLTVFLLNCLAIWLGTITRSKFLKEKAASSKS